jgi:enoyl-CoA hydratase/carnithine racemase
LKEDETLWSKSSEFFKEEYAVDAYISRMTKPIVTFMTGNTRESIP